MDPFASALEQAAAVRRREVSARELVDMYLERIARDGGRTNAFWLTTPELARSHLRLILHSGLDPDDVEHVRQPLKSWGGSIRANVLGLLILRLDYTKPLDRTHGNPYWTVSIGPTF